MENDLNNTSRLDELQAQYDILKRKFEAQQIVNHDLVHQVAKAKMSKMQRKLRRSIIFCIVMWVFCAFWMIYEWGCSLAFFICFCLLTTYSIIQWAVQFRKVLRKTTTTEDIREAAESYKASFRVSRIRWIIGIPLGTAYIVWGILESMHMSFSEVNWGELLSSGATIGVIVGLSVGIISARRQKKKDTAVCDEIISSLSEE